MARRAFLLAGLGLAAALLTRLGLDRRRPRRIEGRILGASAAHGHRLRGGSFPAPSETRRAGIVIVGGGIAGLSAAWRLQKKGFTDFTLLELEGAVGGNSTSGENSTASYPWGAHYVPIPTAEATFVRELFEELGVIEGYDAQGLPLYNESTLCADPQERLLIHGRWQEGLIPHVGLSEADDAQIRSFLAAMEAFKAARGSDGKPAFTIPLDKSSRDPAYLALDRLTMARYMDAQGWTCEPLRWYVNYCCLDDYGCRIDQVSAWAGIHYFASRSGRAANAQDHDVLTWPEGNGWIVKQLESRLRTHLQPDALVFNVQPTGSGEVFVDSLDTTTGRTTRIMAQRVIMATPRFVAARLIPDLRQKPPDYLKAFDYSPWMVANLTVDSLPQGPGAPLCWDNVSYDSPSLGYIVATHQSITRYPGKSSVLTYYLPLSETDPATARAAALSTSHQDWAERILQDLERMHPGIREHVTNLDVWLWGHAMVRPVPGFLWGKDREAAQAPHAGVHFAHSDMSGLSIFEEAQYRGVMAADQALARVQGSRDRA